jgi:hypothetical protein
LHRCEFFIRGILMSKNLARIFNDFFQKIHRLSMTLTHIYKGGSEGRRKAKVGKRMKWSGKRKDVRMLEKEGNVKEAHIHEGAHAHDVTRPQTVVTHTVTQETHAHIHNPSHTRTKVHDHTQEDICPHTHTHTTVIPQGTFTHTHIHTHTHTHTHTYTHKHNHSHAYTSLSLSLAHKHTCKNTHAYTDRHMHKRRAGRTLELDLDVAGFSVEDEVCKQGGRWEVSNFVQTVIRSGAQSRKTELTNRAQKWQTRDSRQQRAEIDVLCAGGGGEVVSRGGEVEGHWGLQVGWGFLVPASEPPLLKSRHQRLPDPYLHQLHKEAVREEQADRGDDTGLPSKIHASRTCKSSSRGLWSGSHLCNFWYLRAISNAHSTRGPVLKTGSKKRVCGDEDLLVVV